MLKKTITYEDYDGIKCTEDFWFGLTRTEMTMLSMSEKGGLATFIRRIAQERDSKKLSKLWEDMILLSYGEKSDDGKHFIKSEESRNLFKTTPAYDVLFMELFGNNEATIAFLKGVVPLDVAKQINDNEINAKIKQIETENVIDLSSNDK